MNGVSRALRFEMKTKAFLFYDRVCIKFGKEENLILDQLHVIKVRMT